MAEFFTSNESETEALGKKLGALLKGGDCVAFFGSLGVGKTAFTRGIAQGMNISSAVSSPTFALVNDYGGNPPLVHFDMYKVESWDDLYSSGFFDYLDAGAVLAVEWSENIENALPENSIKVEIKKGDNDSRRIIMIEGIDIK